MRKYYLFNIKKEVYEYYKKNKHELYNNLKCLSKLKKEDFNHGVSLFHQLCEPFDVDLLNNYLIDKYKLISYNGKFELKNTYIYLKSSRIIVKTNVNLPGIFLDFKCYNRLIFVIDFEMKDYFFLCDSYNTNIYAYN